jgi:hypothetical protein
MPEWMRCLLDEAKRGDCSLALRLFIIKVILNREKLFAGFAEQWLGVILEYLSLKENGGVGFHYFYRDVCMLLL